MLYIYFYKRMHMYSNQIIFIFKIIYLNFLPHLRLFLPLDISSYSLLFVLLVFCVVLIFIDKEITWLSGVTIIIGGSF